MMGGPISREIGPFAVSAPRARRAERKGRMPAPPQGPGLRKSARRSPGIARGSDRAFSIHVSASGSPARLCSSDRAAL